MSANLYDRLSRISAFAPVRRADAPVIEGDHRDALARLGAELDSNAYTMSSCCGAQLARDARNMRALR